jgi:hypothetical protein
MLLAFSPYLTRLEFTLLVCLVLRRGLELDEKSKYGPYEVRAKLEK